VTISTLPPLPAERCLEPPLLRFLAATGRIRYDTAIIHEFPWNGRRIDIATRTITGINSAYELKIGNVGRAIEQATYNTLSFDRSWIVVNRDVSANNSELSARLGIGVIVVGDNKVRIQLNARPSRISPQTKRRLAQKLSHSRFW
jgi:hypothetical protein